MTTGEKLAKLRKEFNYTQEQLAETLNVSRQSISKWESNTAYPEIAKMIQLSELYNCSLDYLIKDTQSKENPKEIFNENLNIKKHRKVLFISVWTTVSFALHLLFYGFPFVTLITSTNSIIPGYGGTITVSVSAYRLLFTSNYQLGNFFILINFLILLFITFIGVLAYFDKTKRVFFKYIRIASIVETVLWFVLLLLLASYMEIGMVLMLLLSLGNCLGLFLVKKNRNLDIV